MSGLTPLGRARLPIGARRGAPPSRTPIRTCAAATPDRLLEDPFRITIIAPHSVVSTWRREALPAALARNWAAVLSPQERQVRVGGRNARNCGIEAKNTLSSQLS